MTPEEVIAEWVRRALAAAPPSGNIHLLAAQYDITVRVERKP